MPHKKTKQESGTAIRTSVRKEMAKPRMARSARIAELNLDTARISEQPSVSMPGTVDKIIPSRVRANTRRRRLLLERPTAGIKISVLKNTLRNL
jgi:hypothetical protein